MQASPWPVLCALLAAALSAAAFATSGDLGFSRGVMPRLIAHYERLFGPGVRGRLAGWKDFVRVTGERMAADNKGAGGLLLRPVNLYFNRAVPWVSDQAHWGAEDHWATPAEALSANGADCEDYAIAKYFTLKELGIPISRLRLVYARTLHSPAAHMVLAYYPEPQSDPLILDNLQESIAPASGRPDLIPVYSFNDEDLLFPQPGAPNFRMNPASNRKWKGDLPGELAAATAIAARLAGARSGDLARAAACDPQEPGGPGAGRDAAQSDVRPRLFSGDPRRRGRRGDARAACARARARRRAGMVCPAVPAGGARGCRPSPGC